MKHPCHTHLLPNMRRIEGQMRGIAKMIEDEKYCIDILNQIRAVRNSLASVEGKILTTHLKNCVKDSLSSTDLDAKVEELVKALKR